MRFPFHRQETEYSCGAACMRMALEWAGIPKTEKQVISLLGTRFQHGTNNRDFPRVAEKYRLNYRVGRNASISDIRECLRRHYCVIVCYVYAPEKTGHYSVVKKITANKIHFRDPCLGPAHAYPLPEFRKNWRNGSREDPDQRWFFAVKKPK
ncbi:MAG: C39 family peptidase [Candidatus Diapherotrites archaeon]|nr:C39 family peptidase [Candidatus Diapherotrites archaeon]